VKTNVDILHYKRGELVEVRRGHNIWTNYGRTWLSKMVGYLSFDPVTVEKNARLRYFGLGMGGNKASLGSLAGDFLAAYPPGYDPNASDGHSYQQEDPTGPPISTLERPIRRSGPNDPVTDPYPGDPTDVWLYEDVDIYRQDNQSLTVDQIVDCTGGELIYGSFLTSGMGIVISEAGLFNDDALDVSPNQPYSPLVAYINFGTIQLTVESIVRFSWTIRFADAS
jgi:hypothetical protein